MTVSWSKVSNSQTILSISHVSNSMLFMLIMWIYIYIYIIYIFNYNYNQDKYICNQVSCPSWTHTLERFYLRIHFNLWLDYYYNAGFAAPCLLLRISFIVELLFQFSIVYSLISFCIKSAPRLRYKCLVLSSIHYSVSILVPLAY